MDSDAYTLVIVDNEPFELSKLEQLLHDDAYSFERAYSGNGAKQLLQELGPQTTVVVLDWMLPDVEGLELLTWITSQPFAADVEVVVHSEAFTSETVEKAIECGAYYFLTKPFEDPQLEAIVRAAVEAVGQRRALQRLAAETRDAVRLLDRGVFRFRTLEEAELLAIHLASACGQTDLSLGLRELLVNAVEHGNLAISYEEKGQLQERGCFSDECKRRLELQEYRERHVEVSFERESSALTVTIKDEGDGFDFERYQTLDMSRLFDTHGRGVLIASATLNLTYTAPGNQVSVRLPAAG